MMSEPIWAETLRKLREHVRMRVAGLMKAPDAEGLDRALKDYEAALLERLREVEQAERERASETARMREIGVMLHAAGLQSYTDERGRIYVVRASTMGAL